MTSSQVNVTETPPMSQEDLKNLANNETDENGLILGKFKSVEDLAASYKELEGKLGTVTEEDQPQATEEEGKQQSDSDVNYEELYGDGVYSVLQEVGIDPKDISNRFMEEGNLNDDDYAKLQEGGFSRTLVDTYLEGLRSAGNVMEIAGQQIQGIKDSVGGEESYSQMVNWALNNLPAAEVDAFNQLTETGSAPAIKMAVQGLYSQYNNAMGIEPNLVTGKAASSGPNPYRSTAEVVAAMSDKRYGKDVTYTQSVQEKLANSDVFT
tara:strand:+ start:1749 stop:2546 length:798 start_codon:yes stop_codon:yes gene_type:complete